MNWSGKRIITCIAALGILLLAGCGGHQQSVIDPGGPLAGRTAGLWWFFFWLLTAIFFAVLALTLWTLTRRHRGIEQESLEVTHLPSEQTESKLTRVVAVATIATVVILFILLIGSVVAGKANADLGSRAKNAMVIDLTGNQWWWQVRYDNPDPRRIVTTANEIHIPIGRPVEIMGRSNDVIHSFWVPNLHGKRDLIPNYPTTIFFEADEPGVYWGQCAEFCGFEHAKMRFMVKAESEDDFNAWYAAAQQPSGSPANDSEARGQQIFLTSVCTQCHTISGTPASGRVGPNLTHVASKPFIASGSLVNNRENLTNWISDPQAIKPGIRMPMNTYSQEDLNALADYIQSLK